MEFKDLAVKYLKNRFWTHLDELVSDVLELADDFDIEIEVGEVNHEYISIESEDEEVFIYLGHANNTIWIQQIKM